MRIAEAAEHPEALFFLGHQCLRGHADKQSTASRALEYFLLASTKGHAEALCSAGAMYYNGIGVPVVSTGDCHWDFFLTVWRCHFDLAVCSFCELAWEF